MPSWATKWLEHLCSTPKPRRVAKGDSGACMPLSMCTFCCKASLRDFSWHKSVLSYSTIAKSCWTSITTWSAYWLQKLMEQWLGQRPFKKVVGWVISNRWESKLSWPCRSQRVMELVPTNSVKLLKRKPSYMWSTIEIERRQDILCENSQKEKYMVKGEALQYFQVI